MPVRPITVLLAEDHTKFRKSLKLLVEMEEDIRVIGEAKNGREAVELNDSLKPDIIIMDIGMPLFNGLEATREISKGPSATKVLILSSYFDPEYIEKAVTVGASGYLIKQSSAPVLVEAIRKVLSGEAYFSKSISKVLRDKCQKVFDKDKLSRK